MGAVGQADRSRGARHLLHGDAMGEIAEPGAAPFLLDGDAVQPELAHLRPEIARKHVVAIDLGGPRRDLVARKVLHRRAQLVEVLAEAEIKSCPSVGDHW